MKKKLFSVMLVAALATSLLAGCGSEKAEDTESSAKTATEVAEVTESVETESTESVESTEAVESTETKEQEVTETEEASPYSFTDMTATLYAHSAVNVRDLPDASGNKIGGLSTNQEVIVSGKCNETGWYRIEYNEGDAYVSDKYLGDCTVETAKNTSSSSSSQSSTGTSSTNNDSQPAASSDSGSNTVSTASEELPSNPYPLNTLVEDTGSSVSFYCLETFTNGVSNGYPYFYDTARQATEYIMNMGKTPGDVVFNGTVGEYKEGIVWKWTRYYN